MVVVGSGIMAENLTSNEFNILLANTIVTGTYSSSGIACTVTTSSNHNLSTGMEIYLKHTSGTGFDGSYKVAVISPTEFSVEYPFARTTSGNISLLPEIRLRSL